MLQHPSELLALRKKNIRNISVNIEPLLDANIWELSVSLQNNKDLKHTAAELKLFNYIQQKIK